MNPNEYYNQLAQSSTSAMTDRESIASGIKSAKQRTIQSLTEGIGAGFLEPSSMSLLKYSGKKALQITSKVLPKTTAAISDLAEGTEGIRDVRSMTSKVMKNVLQKGVDNATIKYTRLKEGLNRTANNYRGRNIPTRSNVETRDSAQLNDPFKLQDNPIDMDLRNDYFDGKISKTDMRLKQQIRDMANREEGGFNDLDIAPARSAEDQAEVQRSQEDRIADRPLTELTRDSKAVDTSNLNQQKTFNSRLRQLGQAGDNDDLNEPQGSNQGLNQPGTGGNTQGGGLAEAGFTEEDAEDLFGEGTKAETATSDVSKAMGGLSEMADIDAAGGFDPVADVVGLVAGLGVLFGGMSEAEKVKTPYIQPSIHPAYQVGV